MRFSRSGSMAVIMLLLMLMGSMMVQQNEACRLLGEESWARQGSLLLQGLQKGPVRPPGNGCSYTGGGGAPCTTTRNFAAGHAVGVAPPNAYPNGLPRFGVTTDIKRMVQS
ncbi:hypothetical protein ACJRO7_008863 [Eucalyptus globulus]|uniref:Uncharacterized protein n=1 Tax=Eucalyptus globulus TaxID=34317 RepID=A0ABD3ISV2_EUCGL